MAPVDRQQRRKERERGAGFSAVSNAPKASFSFSFGQLPSKQASLPPKPSSRRSRTPVASTPRGANGSAQRARSASAQRSSTKRRTTPVQSTGKRKRGDKHARSGDEDDGELDQLSPDNDKEVRSIEKSRKAAAPVSPIREEAEELLGELDELSIAGSERGSARSVQKVVSEVPQETPAAAKARRSIKMVEKTLVVENNDVLGPTPQQAPVQPTRFKSRTPAPTTPAIVARRNINRLASGSGSINVSKDAEFNADDAEGEDELLTPRPNTATPVPSLRAQSLPSPEEPEEMEIDELSPPTRQSENHVESSRQPTQLVNSAEDQLAPHIPANRRKPRPAVQDKEDLVQTPPAASKPRRTRRKSPEVEQPEEDQEPDPLSPERGPLRRPPSKSTVRSSVANRTINVSTDAISSNRPQESEEEEESPEPTHRPAPKPKPAQARPLQKERQRSKPSNDQPPRKRQKHSGPIQTIQVMRLKGEKLKGYTVADTTRTAMEEYIDDRVSLLSNRYQGTQDLARRKQIKTRINLQLSFKEALTERMMDLQDVNDCFTIRAQKLKAFKKHNAELRKEILATQESRQEIALEYDNVLAEFEMEREAFEARNKLSASMFDIQAAVKRGKESAIEQLRESEGPDIPLSMFLENVGRDVGSVGGGLLSRVSMFNGVLERAAGVLEGRA